jgi:hypothetical protein
MNKGKNTAIEEQDLEENVFRGECGQLKNSRLYGLKVGVEVVTNTILCPCQETNPGFPACSQYLSYPL